MVTSPFAVVCLLRYIEHKKLGGIVASSFMMVSSKRNAFLLLLTVFVVHVVLFATKHLFDQVTGRESGWPAAPVLKKAVVKQDGKIISKALPSPRVDLSINLVVVPYLQYNASDEAIIERKREFLTALQRNLNHKFVSYVHVLTTNAHEMLQHSNLLTNQSKLIVSELKSIGTMQDSFDYISKNLVDKDVVFANADIYLGGGFNRVDATVLSNRNIMYALTRRIAQEEKEKCGETDLCVEHHYVGSHDTFLFHLTEPLPEKALKHLDMKLPSPVMENVLIWVFQHQLNYCTLNPCTILETFHLHCSNKMGKKMNHFNYSGLAPFTKTLVC